MKKSLAVTLILIAMLLLLLGGHAGAQQSEPATRPTDPEGVLRAIFAALNDGDVDGAVALVAEDAVLVHIPPPPGIDDAIGKEGLREWWNIFVERHGRIEITEIYVHGDKVAFAANVSEDFFTSKGVPVMVAEMVAIVQGGLLESFTITFTEASGAIFDVAFMRELNKETIRRGYEEMWSQGNLAVADEIHAADVVDRHTGETGIEGIKEIVTLFRTAFPDMYVTVDSQVAEGDLVVSEVTFHLGAYRGGLAEAFGIPDSTIGKESTAHGVDFARFEDGKIVETWGTHDDLGWFQQLGFELAPPAE